MIGATVFMELALAGIARATTSKVSSTSLGIAWNAFGRAWPPKFADVEPWIVLSMSSIDISGRKIQFIQTISARKSAFFVPIKTYDIFVLRI